MGNSTPMTLHIRLTKACNADCSYCSSWQENPDKRMSVDDFKKSLQYIVQFVKDQGLGTTHFNLQYLGGEILLIPEGDLKEMVMYSRKYLRECGYSMRDGVQTNMIGSKDRLLRLTELFQGRLGTSIDTFGTQRTVNGSSDQYKVFFRSRDEDLSSHMCRVPGVFTMDASTYSFALKEAQKANEERRNLTVKAVFSGGREIDEVQNAHFDEAMMGVLDAWFLKQDIIIEPFFTMLKRHLQSKDMSFTEQNLQQCHFQSNCAHRSMNLEPNGDLYICQDLADMSIGLLGNALNSSGIDLELWNHIADRPNNLTEECYQCPYFSSCEGGCMVDAFQIGKSFYGKTGNCSLWKKIFSYFDDNIDSRINETVRWVRRMDIKR